MQNFESVASIGSQLDSLNKSLNDATRKINDFSTKFANAMNAINQSASAISSIDSNIRSFGDNMSNTISTLSGLNAAVSLVEKAINAKKIKVLAMNLAWKANPFGLVAAAAAVLVGGLVALTRYLGRTSEETQELKDESDKLIQASDSLIKSLNESTSAHQERIKSIDAEAGASSNLLARIEELSTVSDKSITQRKQMATYVDLLNNSMEGLNLQYDVETGLLDQSTEAIRRMIESRQEQARIAAAQERANEIAREQFDIEMQLKDVQAQRIEVFERLSDSEVTSSRERRELWERSKYLAETKAFGRKIAATVRRSFACVAFAEGQVC